MEQTHPEMKDLARGTGLPTTIWGTLESPLGQKGDGTLPERLAEGTAPPDLEGWKRTLRVRKAIAWLNEKGGGAAEQAVYEIASSSIANALRVGTSVDHSLLREIVAEMKLPPNEKFPNKVVKDEAMWGLPDFVNPLPMDTWANTLFSEHTIQELRDTADAVQVEVKQLARRVGVGAAPHCGTGNLPIKDYHLEFHRALARCLFDDAGDATKAAYLTAFGQLLDPMLASQNMQAETTLDPECDFPFSAAAHEHMRSPMTQPERKPSGPAQAVARMASFFAANEVNER